MIIMGQNNKNTINHRQKCKVIFLDFLQISVLKLYVLYIINIKKFRNIF